MATQVAPAEPTQGTEREARRRWLRVALVLLPALGFVALLAFGMSRTGGPPDVGEPAPDLSGPLLEGGGDIALSDLEGKPVFVNFWWSGCAPCKDEAPIIEDAYRKYGDDVAFLGVNIRDARSEALAFADRYGMVWPSVRDEGQDIYRRWGLTGQPESFFIDSKGVLVQHVAGPVFESDLTELLDTLAASDG